MANVVQAVQANLSLTSIGNIEFILPDIVTQNQLFKILHSLHCQVLANVQQSETLANIRDTLLPKLMSGEIRVKEAETIIKEVV